MSNQSTQGIVTYLKTTEETFCFLNNCKTTMIKQVMVSQHEEENVAFLELGEQDKQQKKSDGRGSVS